MDAPDSTTERISSGTAGLDRVLHGGIIRGQTALLSGGPGTGKTVLALQFLAESDGSGLYIGFEEREPDIRANAAALGIDLSDVTVLDLSADGDRFFSTEEYSVFSPEEVEGEDILERIAASIDAEKPDRLVVDPLTELRSMLPDEFRFRRNISSLVNELKNRGITMLCTAQYPDASGGRDLRFLGDVSIEIRRESGHRSLEVTKFRGSEYADGEHTYRIRTGTGGAVYPKLVPGAHHRETDRNRLRSGVDALDSLLGGGIERGSVTVLSGPSGVGKTTVGSLFLLAAAERGDRARGYLFEELRSDYLYRSTQLGLSTAEYVESGRLHVEEIESLSQSPDEFAHRVRAAVEEGDTDIVMIDGVAGYRLGLRGDNSRAALTRELHALCRYLKRMGVTVVLIEEVSDIGGGLVATDERISYLADNIVFLRYAEFDGEIGKTIGVLKKRFGDFERSVRRLSIESGGVRVGERLADIRSVLHGASGNPEN